MHDWTKYLSVIIACSALAGYVGSYGLDFLRQQRRTLLFAFLTMALGSASIALLKSVTNKHCPWDLEMYGGYAPYVRLLEPARQGIKPGECFPSGHATTGFCMMGLYFIWYRRRPVLAKTVLVGTFMYGLILGLGRILQGAHFLSHNLWSAIICWYIALGLYRVLLYEADNLNTESAADNLVPSVE